MCSYMTQGKKFNLSEFLFIKIYCKLYDFLCEYISVHVLGACGGQKRVLDPLKLWLVLSLHMDAVSQTWGSLSEQEGQMLLSTEPAL